MLDHLKFEQLVFQQLDVRSGSASTGSHWIVSLRGRTTAASCSACSVKAGAVYCRHQLLQAITLGLITGRNKPWHTWQIERLKWLKCCFFIARNFLKQVLHKVVLHSHSVPVSGDIVSILVFIFKKDHSVVRISATINADGWLTELVKSTIRCFISEEMYRNITARRNSESDYKLPYYCTKAKIKGLHY